MKLFGPNSADSEQPPEEIVRLQAVDTLRTAYLDKVGQRFRTGDGADLKEWILGGNKIEIKNLRDRPGRPFREICVLTEQGLEAEVTDVRYGEVGSRTVVENLQVIRSLAENIQQGRRPDPE